MTFGEKVKAVRLKLFLSQQAMAEKLNVSFSTINRWERGHSKPNFKAQAEFDRLCKENGIEFER
jgi:putative transcriptional regulator